MTMRPDETEFMAAVKELATAAMSYGVALVTNDGGANLRTALEQNPDASLGEALGPFVDCLLTIRPRLVDQLRDGDHG